MAQNIRRINLWEAFQETADAIAGGKLSLRAGGATTANGAGSAVVSSMSVFVSAGANAAGSCWSARPFGAAGFFGSGMEETAPDSAGAIGGWYFY